MANPKNEKTQLKEIADIYTGLPMTRYRKYPNLHPKTVATINKTKHDNSPKLSFRREPLPNDIEEKESFSKYFLKNNDILFKVQSPNYVIYYEEEPYYIKDAIVPSNYIIIRVNEENYDKYNPEYVYEIIKSDYVKRQLNKYSEGKRSIISINNLKNIEIPVISIEKQMEFSNLLTLINKKIQIQLQQIEMEKQIKEGIINDIIHDGD